MVYIMFYIEEITTDPCGVCEKSGFTCVYMDWSGKQRAEEFNASAYNFTDVDEEIELPF